jgi:hypothetical protein
MIREANSGALVDIDVTPGERAGCAEGQEQHQFHGALAGRITTVSPASGKNPAP